MVATISVVSGLNYGIKRLSQLAFGMGAFLQVTVFALDNPWYLLNVMCQTVGHYLQYVMQLGWFCDAFAQLNWGEG